MKKTLSIVLSAAILQVSFAPASVWASVVAASVRIAPSAGGSGVAGAVVGPAVTRNLITSGINNLKLSLGSGLFRPAQMTTTVVGRAPASVPIGTPVAVQPVSNHAVREARPLSKKAPRVTSQGRLAGMETRIRTAGDKKTSASEGKLSLDAVWDQVKARKSGGAVDIRPNAQALGRLNASKEPANVDKGFSPSPKEKGLQPAGPRKGKLRRMLVLPAAMAGIAALPKVFAAAYAHPTVQVIVNQFMTVVASLPSWMQTGVWIGTGFGAAWALPKVVRAASKWVFNQVDWDPLRESYLVNLASSAAWFGAIGFAVFQLGGLAALGINAGLFAATLALANQDLAKNLASGFQLYRNREHEYDFGDEVKIWGEQGRLESVNIRFMTLNTSENKDAEYDRVMMANEKVRSLGITNFSLGKKGALLGAVAIPAILLGPYGPYIVIAALWFAGSVAKEWSASIQLEADKVLPDREKYKKLRSRSKIVDLIANATYIGGLIMILNLFGVPAVGMTAAMGILAAAAGFWTKEVASDLVAGLMIAVWRPFGKGDVIQVGKHPRGVVETITPRTIRIRLEDGAAHYIPLEDLMKDKIRIGLKAVPEEAAE